MKLKHKSKKDISIYILKIAGLGILFTALSILAPQLPYVLLRQLIRKKFGQNYNQKQLSNSLNYLKRKQFIAFEHKDKKIRLILTKLGRKKLQQRSLDEITIKKTTWDQHWRILTFDIPEAYKPARHFFRKKLKSLGFYHFQRSVFISPYKCEEEVDLLARHLKIRSYVHVLTADRFYGDMPLVKKFRLK